jgi:hypothetical protein
VSFWQTFCSVTRDQGQKLTAIIESAPLYQEEEGYSSDVEYEVLETSEGRRRQEVRVNTSLYTLCDRTPAN